MNLIALIQLLKNTEGGLELLRQIIDIAARINIHRRVLSQNAISQTLATSDIFKFGFGHSIVFAGIIYEAAMEFPVIFKNFGNIDVGRIIRKLKFKLRINDFDDLDAELSDNILIELAEILLKLKSQNFQTEEESYFFSKKALKTYAPLANRLGMHQLKDELEIRAFKSLYPKEAEELNKFIAEYYYNSDAVLSSIIYELGKKIGEAGIKNVYIKGRKKNPYRIYEKLLTHNRQLLAIHDIIAGRIIVNDVFECYSILDIVHRLWKPVKKRQKDYIANPKKNGYQSLHTTVYYGNQTVEFQIRTKKMDIEAEYGVAAHWMYKGLSAECLFGLNFPA